MSTAEKPLLDAWLETINDRLFALLGSCAEDNGDSYNGKRLTVAAVQHALKMFIAPTVNGGLSLEWENGQVSIEFGPDGKVVGIMWDRSE